MSTTPSPTVNECAYCGEVIYLWADDTWSLADPEAKVAVSPLGPEATICSAVRWSSHVSDNWHVPWSSFDAPATDEAHLDAIVDEINAGTFTEPPPIPDGEPTPPPITRYSLDASNRPAESYLQRPDALDPTTTRDNYDLAAPYQRGSVWTLDQRRALVLSFLRKVPTGSVIVATQPYDAPHYYRVVDGVQRITTLRLWDRGEFSVPGWWWRADCLTDGEAARRRWVTSGELSTLGQRLYKAWHVSTIETDADRVFVEVEPGTGTTGSARQYKVRRRTAAERLAYEAELYGLINGGGTPQTADDMARAARIAEGQR